MSDYFLNHVNEINAYRRGIALSSPPYWVKVKVDDQEGAFDGWVCCEPDNQFAYIYTADDRDRISEYPIIIHQYNIVMMSPIVASAPNLPKFLFEKYDKIDGWVIREHPKEHSDG